MKQLILFFAALILAINVGAATPPPNGTPIPLTPCPVAGSDLTNGQNTPIKTPPAPLTVYLDGHTLLFAQAFGDAVAVELRDATDNVVYTDSLPAGSQTLTLPSTLSGNYTLLIYVGSWVFCGEMSL